MVFYRGSVDYGKVEEKINSLINEGYIVERVQTRIPNPFQFEHPVAHAIIYYSKSKD